MRIFPFVVALPPLLHALLFFNVTISGAADEPVRAADLESTLVRMRELGRERKWQELIAEFKIVDFAAWPTESAPQAAEALHLRGQAYSQLKQGRPAEVDLKAALKLAPRRDIAWLNLAENYMNNLGDDAQALDAYRRLLALTGRKNGWLPITATLAAARILTDQVRTDEALQELQHYDESDGVAPIWRIRLLRASGHVYAAQGKEQESLAKFREALDLESRQ